MKLNLRQFNNGLSVVVLILSAYIFLMPVMPAASWWAQHQAPLISKPATAKTPPPQAPNTPPDHTLVIPSLAMQETIHEGRNEATLSKGVWKLPTSSTPEKGSNTVMAGHRYTYSGSGVFYHLDKVKTGDLIYIYWGDKRYTYDVNKVEEVPPTEVSVEAPTQDSIVTVYTCTPLWSFKDRLVIQAKLVETI
jgi:LPXTG-site transpeptidase (sortase) family protein